MQKKITVDTRSENSVTDLTSEVNNILENQKKDRGVCNIFVLHTTCALTTGEIGEGTAEDLLEVMKKIIPGIRFRHMHDPAHAWTHMASSILGASLCVPFDKKKLILGTWQSILLVEFDGPRERTVCVTVS